MSDFPTVDIPVRQSEPFLRPATITNAIGILRHLILPSFGVQGGLSVIAYGIARTTNRFDLKDWLWPTGMVLNAWWTAVGRHTTLTRPASILDAVKDLSFSQQVLLGAVTAWGGRLAYQVISRSVKRGKDDPRYEGVKREHGFWNKASILFGLEAAFQTLISIPFTMPFRTDVLSGFSSAPASWEGPARWAATGLFTAGFALETIADWQLASHKEREAVKKEQGESGELLRKGVFSIVRHPNYLGDALCHLAFPLWTYGCGLFHVSQLLGPAANYFFLRWIGGDRENEAYQSQRYAKEDRDKHAQLELYQLQKNSFWPSIFEIVNPWAWTVAAIGTTAACAEYLFESRILAAGTAVNPINPVVGETLAALN
ncbi:hypothetical protein M409DRAFT_64616 [Zasmidium cellare ATCC 36951]|uniref:Uncharacterized protein n=1 Tax=Zasmidium cellare ATCC 36951 TaxID=1080233 RepID=A0A6A6CWW6_ZASCE|nr:uncharacterized protein M409DRAFT_64616 [Zasmidium cellare ATCC 36951]KAF2170299.1 hypothetical protein M409DRAFT_64616 [Zasmidium cellare ATCC 36951]